MNTPNPHDRSELEPIDYLAKKYADGVPGAVKYMFSSEDWLALKDAVRKEQAQRDAVHKAALLAAVGPDEDRDDGCESLAVRLDYCSCGAADMNEVRPSSAKP